ncbi:MAG: hypothetical protein ACR2OI_06845 [Acidimicrobiia bacterium]
MSRSLTTIAVALLLVAAACSSDDESTTTSADAASTPTATLVGLEPSAAPDAVACPPDIALEDWELEAAVLLPGFVLPDGTEHQPATYRLLFQRGADGGYATVPEAAEAATAWLPAEFQPDIRSIVLNHLGRNYVFEGALVEAGPVPGSLQEPCLLLAATAQIVVWYSLQVADPFGEAQVFWVWQQQGLPIAIEPYVP